MNIVTPWVNACMVVARWLSHKNIFFIDNTNNLIKQGNKLSWEGNNPQCALKASNCLAPRMQGFYMLEFSCGLLSDRGISIFHINVDLSLQHKSSFALRMVPGQQTKRIVYFNHPVSQLRWDPASQKGQVENVKIRFSKLTKSFALKRMHEKIHNDNGGISCDIAISCDDLYKKYDLIFSRQLNGHYDDWIRCKEPTLWNKPVLNKGPRFSIIVPVFNTNPQWLNDCVESVLSQTYTNWQLILVDDASNKAETVSTLKLIQKKLDSRIEIIWRKENGHISSASNTALSYVTGDYVVLMDHDDLLSVHALNEILHAIKLNPNAALVYSDEDKIDAQGKRYEAHFKPDFSPDLLTSQNYISHISVLKTCLINKVDGFREGVEGSQDHDLLLRCLPYLTPQNVVHIPKVLYHWRAVEGSTALSASEKNYTQTAGLKALTDYARLNTCGAMAIHAQGANTYRLQWPILNSPLVSLLIPTRDGLSVLKPCIESILDKTDYKNFEILVLNNDSVEAESLRYFEFLSDFPNIRVIDVPGDFNYSAINNEGVSQAKGSVIGLINNDIEVIDRGWLTEMVSQAIRPDIGCVGAKLLYENGRIQHGGVILGLGGVANHSHLNHIGSTPGYFERMRTVHNVSAVTAACLLVCKNVYEEVGGLNEEHLKVAFNDVDFCLKVREAGYRNLFTPFATLYHHESVSRGEDDTSIKRERFISEVAYMKNKWQKHLLHDPYYNANFDLAPGAHSYTLENFSQFNKYI